MFGICRLCLSFSTENMWPLSDCDGIVYNNISFSVHIPINNSLPCQVCSSCITKLNDFKHFCLKVKNNEQILQIELNKGEDALNVLYEQIKIGIKKENNCEKMENVIESCNENELILEVIKHEADISSDCGINFDSEDELPLLNIKDATTKIPKTNEEFKAINTRTEANGLYTNTLCLNFKCLTCFEKFISQNLLLNHYNDVHKCKEKTLENTYTLVNNDEKIYKCTKCDKSYDNVRGVKKHVKIHSEENFHCKICGRTYKTVSEIIRHGRAHDGTKMSCSFGCGFSTVYSGALKGHERRHREDYKYKCDTCGKSFQVRTWYEQHQNVHTGEKPYICGICGMAFHMDSLQMRRKLRKLRTKRLLLRVYSPYQRYLKAHSSSVHPEASSKKRYVCVKCSKPCGNMKALTLHLKEHGIMSSVLCDLCGKTLSSTEQLGIHRRLHMGVKPYSCSTCNKSFAKRSNLKLHQVTHSGERAHACDACGKRYGQRSTLLRHIHKHHTGNTKKCQKCDTIIESPAELTAHQKLCSS